MKLRTFIFISVAIIMSVVSASAQVPAQTTPLKVGVINSSMFSNETGGITSSSRVRMRSQRSSHVLTGCKNPRHQIPRRRNWCKGESRLRHFR